MINDLYRRKCTCTCVANYSKNNKTRVGVAFFYYHSSVYPLNGLSRLMVLLDSNRTHPQVLDSEMSRALLMDRGGTTVGWDEQNQALFFFPWYFFHCLVPGVCFLSCRHIFYHLLFSCCYASEG